MGTHRRIILSRDPVTAEEDHMLGRMTTMKRLWSSPSKKPLATAFPQRDVWRVSSTESSLCVLIATCDYMIEMSPVTPVVGCFCCTTGRFVWTVHFIISCGFLQKKLDILNSFNNRSHELRAGTVWFNVTSVIN